MDFPYGETVTVLTAGSTSDPYSGATQEDWTSPATFDVEKVLVADGGTFEPLQDARNQVESDFDLYFQPPVTITPSPHDRLIVRGLTCKVQGRPFLWKWPATGGDAGLVVKAKIVEDSDG